MSELKCNGCRVCCQKDAIPLRADLGDDLDAYRTEEAQNPQTGETVVILAHAANGDCVYLGTDGCTIYARRPAACRAFDCRMLIASMTLSQREKAVKKGILSPEMLNEGARRFSALTESEQRKLRKKSKA